MFNGLDQRVGDQIVWFLEESIWVLWGRTEKQYSWDLGRKRKQSLVIETRPSLSENCYHRKSVYRVAGFLTSCGGFFLRVHPPLEDLQAELQMLHEERDRLSMELKRGAQLIEKKVAEVQDKGT